jgi:hypothetical protein
MDTANTSNDDGQMNVARELRERRQDMLRELAE